MMNDGEDNQFCGSDRFFLCEKVFIGYQVEAKVSVNIYYWYPGTLPGRVAHRFAHHHNNRSIGGWWRKNIITTTGEKVIYKALISFSIHRLQVN